MRWNRLKSAKSLRAGQSLIVGYRRVPADSTVQRNYHWIKVPRHATLSHLAMRYKTSVRQLMRWNGLRSAKSLKAGQNLIVGFSDKVFKPVSRIRKIRVPNNTTLSHLALRYKTNISQLMRWNGLKKATDLRAGMKLIVSKPSTLRDSDHKVIRVRSGDTLSKIAMRYRTSVKTLVALNDLKSNYRVLTSGCNRPPHCLLRSQWPAADAWRWQNLIWLHCLTGFFKYKID